MHSDWGRLDPVGIAAEARSYQRWYGLYDIFVDCLPSQDLDSVTTLMSALRAAGVQRIIGNSGTDTVPGIAHAVDVLLDYENDRIPPAARARHDGVMHCWVGHGLRWNQAAEMLRRARAAEIDWIWVTDGRGANPYRDLPTYWREVLAFLAAPPAGS